MSDEHCMTCTIYREENRNLLAANQELYAKLDDVLSDVKQMMDADRLASIQQKVYTLREQFSKWGK